MGGARDDILTAALEVFREHGYERTSVRMIADRAGVPISTLYSHIGSKEQLFLGLVTPVIERAAAAIEAIVAADLPPERKLHDAIVQAVSAFDEHHPELFIYLRDFYPLLEREDPELPRRYEQQWADLVRLGTESGALRPGLDPKVTAYGVLGMVNWMHHWYRPGGRFAAAEIGEQFAAMVIGGLAVRP